LKIYSSNNPSNLRRIILF